MKNLLTVKSSEESSDLVKAFSQSSRTSIPQADTTISMI